MWSSGFSFGIDNKKKLVRIWWLFGSTGRSSAWLECCVRDAEVARSNRVAPIGGNPYNTSVCGTCGF